MHMRARAQLLRASRGLENPVPWERTTVKSSYEAACAGRRWRSSSGLSAGRARRSPFGCRTRTTRPAGCPGSSRRRARRRRRGRAGAATPSCAPPLAGRTSRLRASARRGRPSRAGELRSSPAAVSDPPTARTASSARRGGVARRGARGGWTRRRAELRAVLEMAPILLIVAHDVRPGTRAVRRRADARGRGAAREGGMGGATHMVITFRSEEWQPRRRADATT